MKITSIGLLALAGFAMSTSVVSAASTSQGVFDEGNTMVRVSGLHTSGLIAGFPPDGPARSFQEPLPMIAYGGEYEHGQGHGQGKGHGKGKGRGHGHD